MTPPVDVYGTPGPRAVVLLHGAVVNRRMWLDVAGRVASTWPVLAPDLPGHGDLAGLPFRIDTAASRLGELMDGRGIEQAVLVGESLGGYVALAVAREQPRRVAGLVLSGASLDPIGLAGTFFRLYGRIAQSVTRRLDAERLASWTRRAMRRTYPEAPLASMSELGLAVAARPIALQELAGRDLFAGLEGLEAPVMIVNGRRDLLNRLGGRSVARRSPGVEVRTIDGAGHGAALARPAAFADELLRFLGGNCDS